MKEISVISFDVEGTLVTTDFSYSIWFEAIPEQYGQRHGLPFEEAKSAVIREYESLGNQASEWYDVNYWFDKFDIGTPEKVMENYQHRVIYFPEVSEVLISAGKKYRLIATSASHRQFLHHLLRNIRPHFSHIFSSISDYKRVKTPEFYRIVCDTLAVAPEQVLHIGDNWQFDCAAAAETGINAVYLDRQGKNDHPNAISRLNDINSMLPG